MKKADFKKIIVSAMLCAVAFLSVFVFRFKVSFLTFDFKDAIISIISLLNGPILGVASAAVVAVLEFLSVSDTGGYGLIMNFLSSASFALACGLVYKYKRSFLGAILSAVTAVVSVTAVMMLANVFVTPLYMDVERADVIAMLAALLLPFNFSKAIMNASVMLIIYKPLTTALRKTGLVPKSDSGAYKTGVRGVILLICAVLMIILTALFLIIKMNGSFELF